MGAMMDSTSAWSASCTPSGGACSYCVYSVMGANVAPRVSFQPGKTPSRKQNRTHFNIKDLVELYQKPARCRSVTSSGCSLTSLFAVWQVKQIGNAAARVPNNLSAGNWVHSHLNRVAARSA